MRILVTGGAGFIGSNLCRRLLNDGNDVICIDNLYSSAPGNIYDLEECENFTFIRDDITSSDCFSVMMSLGPVDYIYHLACAAAPADYQALPLETINVCVNGTVNVLEYAKEVGARVLFSSTSEVYGEPLEHPQKESYRGNVNSLGIRACYDNGKRIAETIMMEYNRTKGVDIRIARIFNTYGPGMKMDDGRVVTSFISNALSGKHLTLFGGGIQTRSFCYIDDMVDGLILLMNSSVMFPVNLGNPTEITIKELADVVIRLCKSNSGVKDFYLPEDDPTRRCPDITRAREVLGWEPAIFLEEGLNKMIQYINKK